MQGLKKKLMGVVLMAAIGALTILPLQPVLALEQPPLMPPPQPTEQPTERDIQLNNFLERRKSEETQRPKSITDQLKRTPLPRSGTQLGPQQVLPFQASVLLTDIKGGKRLSNEPAVSFERDQPTPENALNVVVDPALKYQTMRGAGASMTESSAWLMRYWLTQAQRDTLMRQLYSPTEGIGLNLTRLPMGATDFALTNYTYNDRLWGTDVPQTNFSIGRDQLNGMIPMTQQAQSLNSDHLAISTPWSPPRWMKVNPSPNLLYWLSKGQLNPAYYDSYATYFSKYASAYQAAGIPIYGVSPQNEPRYEAETYPSMAMTAPDQAAFIKNNLGPALNTNIFTWEHNWDGIDYPLAVLGDPAAKSHTDGTTFHCYRGEESRQALVQHLHPDRDIYFTECTGFDDPALTPEGDFRWGMRHIVIGGARNWGQSVMYWNIALNQFHGPQNIGTVACVTCRGLVQIAMPGGATTFTPEYYILGQYSKLVKPGAQRIGSTTYGEGSIETAAFRNPDGSRVLVALNSGVEPQQFIVREGRDSFVYTLQPSAAATFRWAQPANEEPAVTPGTPVPLPDRSQWRAYGVRATMSEYPALMLDGNPATRWSTNAQMTYGHWLMVDFGQTTTINNLSLIGTEGDYPRKLLAEGSHDGLHFFPLTEITPTSNKYELNFSPTNLRYVRLIHTSEQPDIPQWWSVSELNARHDP